MGERAVGLSADERALRQSFVDESLEHLEAMGLALLEVERAPADAERIDALFRPIHTIKGVAGCLELQDIQRLAHEMETLLDQARRGLRTLHSGTISALFGATDVLRGLVQGVRRGLDNTANEPVAAPDVDGALAALRGAAGRGDGAAEAGLSAATSGVRAADPGVQTIDAGVQAPSVTRRGDGTASPADFPVGGSIRVDAARLDALVEAVGELVIAHAMMGASGADAGDAPGAHAAGQVRKIVRDIQTTALALRMTPIGPIFQKMRRVARDAALKCGKPVEVTITGQGTELDQTVIQQIADPLVHLVRNAVSHGIEPAEVRTRFGKPAVGQVRLHACHEGDGVRIEVADDGRGLDVAELTAEARRRGLLAADNELNETTALDVVCAAGFSTAAQVTDVAGRGVGLSVVRRNIEALHGRLEAASRPGQGVAFSIRLPLTLAIIEGLIVGVGAQRLVIPARVIERSVRLEPGQIVSTDRGGALARLRGRLCPLLDLGEWFGSGRALGGAARLVVVVRAGERLLALGADRLIGQQQVVIKPLGARFRGVRVVSGGAILGDGRVGLIVDPAGLVANRD